METNDKHAARTGRVEAWQDLFCTSGWCRAEHWVVQQDQRSPQLWHIAEPGSRAPWAVTAHQPVCPLCGEALVAHIEGFGDPDIAVDNPFVAYIRTLKNVA